ncbi:hypothetical protein ACWEO1_02330 [Kitasatospora cineracea]|uniref:hypothetical protein n=1 Tax=Kitasatospora sp. NRRL B-11411 TaxID=1463822 RepID=UPI0012FF36BE|nr:hypothetical protein [Kitasatospora sp. NRRL B-11411]
MRTARRLIATFVLMAAALTVSSGVASADSIWDPASISAKALPAPTTQTFFLDSRWQ